ncbi:MAG: hypothetical protein ACI841_001152 [Planctomycetota bacterium]|jgi:hypothetical protein
MDSDRDGTLSVAELKAAAAEPYPIGRRVSEVVRRYDHDGDGRVSRSEAGSMWARLANTDQNSDGRVSAAEMHGTWSRGFKARRPFDTEAAIGKISTAVERGVLSPSEGRSKIAEVLKIYAERKSATRNRGGGDAAPGGSD